MCGRQMGRAQKKFAPLQLFESLIWGVFFQGSFWPAILFAGFWVCIWLISGSSPECVQLLAKDGF